MQSAYNGIAVQAAPGAASELAALPGVQSVHAIPLVELDNHSSVPLIGALQAWGTYGKTGTGTSIAVIDTGVDYVHRDFGGSGSSADYLVATSPAANPPSATDNPGAFAIPGIYPSAKVVGGWDFAGDAYTGSGGGAVPIVDPEPDGLQRPRHARGRARLPATASTPMAPRSAALLTQRGEHRDDAASAPVLRRGSIYELRVSGCAGSTALTVAAINRAVDPDREVTILRTTST